MSARRLGGAGDRGRAPRSGGSRAVALRLLGLRAHFRAELEAKLRRRGFADEEVEATLDRLTAEGVVDDARTAVAFAAGVGARRGWGARRLRAELVRRGAPQEAVEGAVGELLPDDDRALARAAADRFRQRRGGNPAALARHLDRLGFSQRAIVAALREAGQPPDDPTVG